MKLKLIRDIYGKDYTAGKLYIDDAYFCDTLEDTNRDLNKDGDLKDEGEGKIYGQTCIPFGTYPVTLVMSPKRGFLVPLLHNVSQFTTIQIHSGNTITDTLGCILVGERNNVNTIYNSRRTFSDLMKIFDQHKDEIHSIEIL